MANAFSLIRGQPLNAQGAPLSFLQGYFDLVVGENTPDIIMGSGTPDGTSEPFKSANKGSIYMRTDNTDDLAHVYVKVDEAGANSDWVGFTMNTQGDALQLNNTLTVGVDDTGHDVKFFGATAGAYWLWDESADTVLRDGGTLFSKAVASGDAGMTVSADGMTADPETATEAGYIAVDIGGTGYQIPIYAA